MSRAIQFVDNLSYKFERFFSYLLSALAGYKFSRVNPNVKLSRSDDSAKSASVRWRKIESNGPLISIIAVTYQQPEALRVFLACFACQTYTNFELIVLHDGPHPPTAKIFDEFPVLANGATRFIETAERYNDYGHTLRDQGIKLATGDFLILTNGDNYYTPNFLEEVAAALMDGACDVVIWDMVHSHVNPGLRKRDSYQAFNVLPFRYYCDVGCIAVRKVLAKAVGFWDKSHNGDATYLEEVLAASDEKIVVRKISKILFVHN